MMLVEPVTLRGRHFVDLEPLTAAHTADIWAIGQDPAIWEFMLDRTFRTPADAEAYMAHTLDDLRTGFQLPFVMRDRRSGAVIGRTGYVDVQRAHHSLEVGPMFVARSAWRGGANLESNYLLLCHAFETLCAERVCIQADARNERSLRSIERTGFVKEGVLRRNFLAGDGVQRDSVMYSLIPAEWPAVKAELERRIAAKAG